MWNRLVYGMAALSTYNACPQTGRATLLISNAVSISCTPSGGAKAWSMQSCLCAAGCREGTWEPDKASADPPHPISIAWVTGRAFHARIERVLNNRSLTASEIAWRALLDQRRYKSKKKAGKGKEGKASSEAEATQPDEFDTRVHEARMSQSLEHYFHELAGLRTGRVSPTLLDGILVDLGGDKINLPHLATVVMKGSRSLAVTVYDRDSTQAVASAIRVSPLDLQVKEEGGQLIVPIPEMTPAARKAMTKLAHQHAEHARVAVRQIRHKAMAEVKAVTKLIGEDEKKRHEKSIDELTKKFISDIDGALASKEKELDL